MTEYSALTITVPNNVYLFRRLIFDAKKTWRETWHRGIDWRVIIQLDTQIGIVVHGDHAHRENGRHYRSHWLAADPRRARWYNGDGDQSRVNRKRSTSNFVISDTPKIRSQVKREMGSGKWEMCWAKSEPGRRSADLPNPFPPPLPIPFIPSQRNM